ncbi:MAG: hypothetical protein Q9224_007693, partial [Gallowayella concinna]
MVLTRTQQAAQEAEDSPNQRDQVHGLPGPDARRENSPPDSRHTSPESSQPDEDDQILEWQGVTLPQFDIPQWRKRDGVPIIVLRPTEFDAHIGPTNGSDNGSEDVGIDSQSDHTISDESDAPASEEDAPTSEEDAPASEEDAPPAEEDASASGEDVPASEEEAPASEEDEDDETPDIDDLHDPQDSQDPQIDPLTKDISDDDEDAYPTSLSIEGLPTGGFLSDLEVE